ncbi:MAG: DNA polymerase III subunit gamma/tau [Candidatus Omnitrophota bacterium]|nr:MAG: DNA polymerase III subunit gamma/tau [Candidatus Omnitrophota bacterium]
MSYLAFALKYRPQNFDEVVGQEHVVTSLKNAILKNRVHHAYLFSGPRGIGKTSMARILAKSLNCHQGPTVTPCGKCASCDEISRGTSLDIIEIDGASNRGIDEIRTLREGVKLSPAHSRFKVYIIDEVHMLTQEAFNALLKTLEEPPSHVKFIFATTHPQKVLPTILSRCQKFQFNLISVEKIVEKLKSIINLEKIKIAENLLYAIGRASGGSIRDAESLLDQLVPVVLEKAAIKDIFSFLGIIDEESLNLALRHLVEKDLTSSLGFVDKIVREGKDLGIFLNSLIEHLRNLLLAKVSVNSFKELIEISPQSKDFIFKLSKQIIVADILKLIDSLIEAKGLSQRLNTVRVPLELAVIKFTYQGEIEPPPVRNSVPVPKKESKAAPQKESSKETKAKKPEKNPAFKNTDSYGELDFEIDDLGLEEQSQANAETKKESVDSSREKEGPADDMLLAVCKAKWREAISYMQKTRAALAAHLSYAAPVSSTGSLVKIGFSKKDAFHKEIVESTKNLKFIEEALSRFMEKSVGVRFVLCDNTSSLKDVSEAKGEEPAVQEEDPSPQDNQSEFLNELLDKFGGKIHTDDE